MMSTRITGLNGRIGVGRRVAAVRSWSRHRKLAVGGVFALLGILAACSSSGTYPVDIFSEMHYTEAYRTFEPPRFLSPDGAVAVDEGGAEYSAEDLGQLENPIDADEASVARGQVLFDVNCVVCHGAQGAGDGPMAPEFVKYAAPRPPADLTEQRLRDVPDSYIYGVVHNGLGLMPAFGDLIQGNEIWDLVNYVRTLQQAAQ
jgi:mono/diheme cytochrome c family protein